MFSQADGVGDGFIFNKNPMFLNGYESLGSDYHGRNVSAMGRTLYFFGRKRINGLDEGNVVWLQDVFRLHRAADPYVMKAADTDGCRDAWSRDRVRVGDNDLC